MKVQFDIDAGSLGESAVEMFSLLSDEQKKEVATKVLKAWLDEPYNIERNQKIQEVTERLMKANHCDARKAQDSYDFRSDMGKYLSSREEMIKGIKEEIVNYYKEEVQNFIREDKKTNEAKDIMLEVIKKDLPKAINDGIVSYVANSFGMICDSLSNVTRQSGENSRIMEDIKNKLSEKLNIY